MKLRDEELAVIRQRAERGVEQGIMSAVDMIAILDTIDALKAEHAASLAAFAQRAAEHWPERCSNARGDFVRCDCDWKSSTKKLDWREPEPEIHHGSIEWKQHIISLIPTADLEYHLALTEAKIEEAKLWSDMEFNTHIATEHTDCLKCGRLFQLTADATRIKAAIEAARRKS